MATPKYLDLFQIDSDEFNSKQEELRKEFIKKNGEKKYYEIIRTNENHPLRSDRTIDTRLSSTQVNELMNDKFTLFPVYHNGQYFVNSFGDFFDKMYSNDLPVFISADSLLYPFAVTFDEAMMSIESNIIFGELDMMLSLIIESIDKKNQFADDLTFFFNVARLLLNGGIIYEKRKPGAFDFIPIPLFMRFYTYFIYFKRLFPTLWVPNTIITTRPFWI